MISLKNQASAVGNHDTGRHFFLLYGLLASTANFCKVGSWKEGTGFGWPGALQENGTGTFYCIDLERSKQNGLKVFLTAFSY